MIETSTDLAAMLDTTDFATPIYQGGVVLFAAYIDTGYAQAFDTDGQSTELLCISDEVKTLVYGDVLSVEGLDYAIRSIKNSARTTRLGLERI